MKYHITRISSLQARLWFSDFVFGYLVFKFLHLLHFWCWGTGIKGLMRGTATVPQGNQELLVVRDKVGRPPGELGVSKSMECDIFPFSALTLLVG